MNKQFLYNIGIFTIISVALLSTGPVFATQSESISISVRLNTAPEIIVLQPADGDTAYSGGIITISIDAEDLEGDELQYQFSVDGEIIQPWQGSPEFNWPTSGVNSGVHLLRVEVNDNYGATASEEASIYLFRMPPPLPSL